MKKTSRADLSAKKNEIRQMFNNIIVTIMKILDSDNISTDQKKQKISYAINQLAPKINMRLDQVLEEVAKNISQPADDGSPDFWRNNFDYGECGDM